MRIDPKLLRKYFIQTTTPEEGIAAEEALMSEPQALKDLLDCADPVYPAELGAADARWMRVQGRITDLTEPTRRSSARSSTRDRSRDWLRDRRWIASAAIGICAVTIAFVGGRLSPNSGQGGHGSEFSTLPGQMTTVQLPDGSTALLGPSTRIRYAGTFGKTDRRVEVSGQALFTVAHAMGEPFVVQTPDAETRVLGTTFAVRRYPSDTGLHVVVADGKVSVMNSVSEIPMVLSAGQEVYAAAGRTVGPTIVADIGKSLGWVDRSIEFTDVPLYEAVVDLSRMYGIDIRVTSERLLRQHVTGAADSSKNVELTVRMLAMTLGGRFERRGNTLYILE